MVKIFVERELCTSCGVCWHEMGDVFKKDEDNLVALCRSAIKDDRKDELIRVAEICPGECITFDATSGS